MGFMDENFLLKNETAKKLFSKVAKDLPIFDYHCHLNPREIAEDKRFKNITEIWLYGDHYKWRFMRSMGVEERYCTGDASDYEKFMAYAKCIARAAGNPLYHWTHLELQRYFGIYEPLSEKTADYIWKKTEKIINGEDFSARKLIEKSKVALIGTTDDPIDTLEYHLALSKDETFKTKVVPSFRPDNALSIEKDGFADYIEKLSEASGISINSFKELKPALISRMDFFEKADCRISDHGLETVPFSEFNDSEIEDIFQNALNEKTPDGKESEKYKTALLIFLAEEYAKRGWVMQLHVSVLRQNNTKMSKLLGPDTGFDSVNDVILADKLNRLLDKMDLNDSLPKTILYSLNERDNNVLASAIGNFQQGGIKSKIQLGSAWWFNDNIDGMINQIKALGNLGALAGFVGMLTDSRSFLSYPRHEYFRRILCNIVGTWVEDGEFTDDFDILKEIIEGICYKNAVEYFNVRGVDL